MSNTPISQDAINAAVWGACDTFRGTVDSSIYKDYVLTMLFLKYVSDVWQDHYDGYKEQYGDHPELIEEMLKNERFVLPPSASFTFSLFPPTPSQPPCAGQPLPGSHRRPPAPVPGPRPRSGLW